MDQTLCQQLPTYLVRLTIFHSLSETSSSSAVRKKAWNIHDLVHILVMHILLIASVLAEAQENIPHNYGQAKKFPGRATHSIQPRSTVNDKFLTGPNGERCMLNDRFKNDLTYGHHDENGWCSCSLCRPGQTVQTPCRCRVGSDHDTPAHQDTVCTPVQPGMQFMDKHNNCTQPYTCTSSCGTHQRKVTECTPWADLKCECDAEEGWFNPDPSDEGAVPRKCRQKPHCKATEEPQSTVVGKEVIFSCRPCPDGYFQPYDDSIASCQPHRNCMVKPGSPATDNVCLNDELLTMTTKQQATGLPASTPERDRSPSSVLSPSRQSELTTESDGTGYKTSSTPLPLDGEHTTPKGDIPMETSPTVPATDSPCDCPVDHTAVVISVILVLILVAVIAWIVWDKKIRKRYQIVSAI